MPTVLILGASRGIGLEFVRQYAADGWRVHATARGDADLQALRALGAQTHRLEATAAADWPALAAALAGERLDLAIYNAGVFGSRSGSAEPPSREEFDAVMQSNVFGAMHALAALAPQIEASGGTLAFVTSQMGSIADAASSYGWVYRASKAALNMAVHSAARERRCTLLLLHPGWVRTDMGGANATLDVATSVAGLRRVIAGATTADNGKFFNYTGKELPW
ncbi:MAG: SDR family oxidoreductase [Betaproteobacteria bacterium]|jgi:NAD(P)-dependent dehydrogenase (short-subunit alcohol dehydrogenase family)